MVQSVFIIAEVGLNHCGSTASARKLIDVAVVAGANAVKFQTYDVLRLATKRAALAPYQEVYGGASKSQVDMLRDLALTLDEHRALKNYSEERGIEFISTAFDESSLRLLLDDIGVRTLKIASGEITNGPLLYEHGKSGLRIVLSTGMSNMTEIYQALKVIEAGYLGLDPPLQPPPLPQGSGLFEGSILSDRVTLLQCTSQYPTEPKYANLKAMTRMRGRFGLGVGFSDHTLGKVASVGAAALGAIVLEKHITLDRSAPGPDHQASSSPSEFIKLVRDVREVEVCLGVAQKTMQLTEATTAQVARKSLVASGKISTGEVFSERNLAIKRPGGGRSPMEYWSLLGTKSSRDYNQDDLIF